MSKKVIKIIILILAVFLLIQIPFFKNVYNNMKNDALEKRDNVAEEYDRVKGKVDKVTGKVIEVKDKVEDTVDTVGEAVEKVGETADKIGNLIGDDEEGEENESEVHTCTEEEKTAEMCTMEYAPVCGNDGETYGNICMACASGNIDTYIMGECIAD